MQKVGEIMDYTKYDPKTGMIAWVISSDENMLTAEDFPHIPGAYDTAGFFVDIAASPPAIKKRPPQSTRQDKETIAADGEEIMTLSALPVPCMVEVDGDRYEVADGLFEWGTRRAGEYALRVTAFPFLDWEGTVTAV